MSGIKKTQGSSAKKERLINNQKIERIKKKHSKMGMVSCILAGTAFLFLGTAVMISFFELEKINALVGGLGACSIILAFMGIKTAMRGRREKNKKYLTCNIGGILNILLLIGLVIIYII